jgi:hypothetical protein
VHSPDTDGQQPLHGHHRATTHHCALVHDPGHVAGQPDVVHAQLSNRWWHHISIKLELA